MGSLYWQINDVWPVASWSSTDYYQKWKALQYYVKKGFEPVLVSPYIDDNKLKVDIVNDKLEDFTAELKMKLMTFDGRVIWENASLVNLSANSAKNFFDINKNEFLYNFRKQIDEIVFVCELVQGGKVISKNAFYFKPFKHLKVPQPIVNYETAKTDNGFDMTFKTDKLAKNIYLQIADEEGFFSDNYFDLLPGETVTINLKTTISEEKLNEVLTLRTLDGAF
jgi:beta-mannosidase